MRSSTWRETLAVSTRDLLHCETVTAPATGLARMIRPAGRAVCRARWQVRVHGAEHVPAQGPVLLAGNHIGLFDGPLLIAFAPRVVHAWVKREMFEGRSGAAMRAMGQISLERAGPDPRAVKQAVRVLHGGGVVAVYPEGSRGGGDVSHTRLGLAYLAMVTGAPVVPVAHFGTRLPGGSVGSVPPRGSRFDVVYGPRIGVAQVPWPRRRAGVEAVAERLRVALADHVVKAMEATGRSLPGHPPDEAVDAAGREGPEVGPATQEEHR